MFSSLLTGTYEKTLMILSIPRDEDLLVFMNLNSDEEILETTEYTERGSRQTHLLRKEAVTGGTEGHGEEGSRNPLLELRSSNNGEE